MVKNCDHSLRQGLRLFLLFLLPLSASILCLLIGLAPPPTTHFIPTCKPSNLSTRPVSGPNIAFTLSLSCRLFGILELLHYFPLLS